MAKAPAQRALANGLQPAGDVTSRGMAVRSKAIGNDDDTSQYAIPERSRSMNSLCNACSSSPSNIDGHADLRVQSLSEDAITFECRQCHCLWSRSYPRGGRYVWRFVSMQRTGAFGAVVPTNSNAGLEARPHAEPGDDSASHWVAIQRSWKLPRRYCP